MSRNLCYTYISLFSFDTGGFGAGVCDGLIHMKIKNFLNTKRSMCLRRPGFALFYLLSPFLRLGILRKQFAFAFQPSSFP